MKHNNLYDGASFPVIIVEEDLSLYYANDAARKAFSSLCREDGVKTLAEKVRGVSRKIKRGEAVDISGEGGYVFVTLVPFTRDGETFAYVFAESSFSIYKSTDGFRSEKSISDAYFEAYDVIYRRLRGAVTLLSGRFGTAAEKELLPYFTSFSRSLYDLDRLSDSLASVIRLQTLFTANGVERIEFMRFLTDMNKARGVFDLSHLSHDDSFLYDKRELSNAVSDITDFLLADSDGNLTVTVLTKETDSHLILAFSTPVSGRKLPVDKAFLLPDGKRRYTLFHARKSAEARGGNMLVRKNGAQYEVLYSVRRLLETDYTGYLASDNILGINNYS